MGTAPGPAPLLELCDRKLMEFVCKVDPHFVWLEEIQEEARRMFTRGFIKEPELMPKTPSQKNRGRKRRIADVQDASRNPIRKRKSPEEDPSREAGPMEEAGPEVPTDEESALRPRSGPRIVVSMPGSQPPAGQREAQTRQADGPEEPPQRTGRKHNCRRKLLHKEAAGELDEEQRPPRSNTPPPPRPAGRVVQPVRTSQHPAQRNQMLMTPTPASRSRSRVIKSFLKRNTPLRVDPKEKEQRRLANLRRKEEAEQLRRLKVEEDKRRRREELKLKREERLRKVLRAREQAEQTRAERIKQMEQKVAPQGKNEKAKEERPAEEKARKVAAAVKAEVRSKQEEEARRLRGPQQEEEEQQRKEKEEQERLLKAAEQEQRREQERLQAERELQEREKALQVHKERLQRELEEKKKKEEQQHLREEQEKKAKKTAATSKGPNMTMDLQSPACTSYQMTPRGPGTPPKINLDNYGMDLNSDDSTDDESQPRKPIPCWAAGAQLSQAILHQYCHPPNLLELFGTFRQLDLEDMFEKSKPRYHKRTSSAAWSSPPLRGSLTRGGLRF